ncbi:hypothetical protein TNIN_231131 [Trichonephila inaurata madagascariensis]|uniref:Speckle-type POZ protein n=1 Tax=Trichonephila inaurata madagascariensis TaxID=2747483 RepID=A0A8X6XVX3_9ARAC|nr:hypothetical protein TNIN_231131 [Trichonephila inaurata madagascariensis]
MAYNSEEGKEPWTTFYWNIENYSHCWQQRGECIKSPTFDVVSTENFEWELALHPRGITDGNFIYFYIFRKRGNNQRRIELEHEIAFLAEDGSILQIAKRSRKTYPLETFESTYESALGLRVPITKKGCLLSKDILRTRCRLWRTDGKTVIPATFFAKTVLKVTKRNFLWDIERFSSLEYNRRIKFVSSELKDDEISLSVGVNEEDEVMISIHSFSKKAKFLKFQSFLNDVNGSNIECGKCEVWPTKTKKEAICILSFSKKYLMENENSYLKNNVLSLYCQCSWSTGYASNEIERIHLGITSLDIDNPIFPKSYVSITEETQSSNKADLKKNVECLCAEGILCDVQLRTTTRTFHAHKNILSALSPKFEAMFETLKQKGEGGVDIPDLDDDTVHHMLLNVYTDGLKDLEWENALKVYSAADKYEILSLKKKCSRLFEESICPSNVCEILILADKHHDNDLKEIAQKFALKHEEDVFNSKEWIHFMENFSTLAADTMHKKWYKKPTRNCYRPRRGRFPNRNEFFCTRGGW